MATPNKQNSAQKNKASSSAAEDLDIVLLCNPRAGGRWRELADILDSEEARYVRRIVTDSLDDIGPALTSLSLKTQLICIYGGDGTIQRILDRMYRQNKLDRPQLAFIGGGTMNVTARWCGLRDKPGENFREIVRAFKSGQLLLKEVPLLRVQQGDNISYGFTFGIGPVIRVLNEYENGNKGKAAAVGFVGKSVLAAWSKHPVEFTPVLEEMPGDIFIDGNRLPYDRYAAVFANVTGRLNIGVEPFIRIRTRDSFYAAAYAVTGRELTLLMPFLARGWLPVDPKSLLKPVGTWKQMAMSYLGKGSFPADPRYVNDIASTFEVRAEREKVYTVDGEILPSTGEPIQVTLGPVVRLAVSSTVGLGPTMRLAAEVTRVR